MFQISDMWQRQRYGQREIQNIVFLKIHTEYSHYVLLIYLF
jgi:hypothetical protein